MKTNKIKIKWKTLPRPSGFFNERQWPDAYYEDGSPCACIYCHDAYTPARARGEDDHGLLTLRIADHSETPWKWRTIKHRYTTLQEAKIDLKKLLSIYFYFLPKQYHANQ